jgi:hypothetical protein
MKPFIIRVPVLMQRSAELQADIRDEQVERVDHDRCHGWQPLSQNGSFSPKRLSRSRPGTIREMPDNRGRVR